MLVEAEKIRKPLNIKKILVILSVVLNLFLFLLLAGLKYSYNSLRNRHNDMVRWVSQSGGRTIEGLEEENKTLKTQLENHKRQVSGLSEQIIKMAPLYEGEWSEFEFVCDQSEYGGRKYDPIYYSLPSDVKCYEPECDFYDLALEGALLLRFQMYCPLQRQPFDASESFQYGCSEGEGEVVNTNQGKPVGVCYGPSDSNELYESVLVQFYDVSEDNFVINITIMNTTDSKDFVERIVKSIRFSN